MSNTNPALTTIDMSFFFYYGALCRLVGYVKHLEALISGPVLTHALFFHLPIKVMVLSPAMLSFDRRLSRLLSTLADV